MTTPDTSVPPATGADIERVIAEIRQLASTPERPKPKDTWDKAAVVTTFLGSVLLASAGLVFTITYNNREAERQQSFRDQQIRAAETDIVVKLLPQLTSENQEVRAATEGVLEAVQEADSSGRTPHVSILHIFTRLALARTASATQRARATAVVAAFAEAPQLPPDVRKEAVDVVASVAAEANGPKAARDIATEALNRIRKVSVADIDRIVTQEPLSHPVTEIILHHSGEVTSDYRGTDTIIALTDYQLRKKKWSQLGWHYAIAPDGAIWLGVPLDQPAAQLVRGHKDKTVSVLLLMDGDKELPSANQPRALGRLLGALCKRSDITPELTFDSRHGFHHDYDPRTSCPGAQLTKDLVISWIRESRGGA